MHVYLKGPVAGHEGGNDAGQVQSGQHRTRDSVQVSYTSISNIVIGTRAKKTSFTDPNFLLTLVESKSKQNEDILTTMRDKIITFWGIK